MKNPALVLALLLSATISALAQSNQSRIVDLDGNGIAGVQVVGTTICYRDPSPPRMEGMSVLTDADGRLTWPGPSLINGCLGPTFTVFTLKKAGYTFTRTEFMARHEAQFATYPPYDDRLPLIQGTALPSWVSVSAASFGAKQNEAPTTLVSTQFIASEMIVAGFGVGLATMTEAAAQTLPTTLAGRRVLIKDSAGTEKAAKLFFVSPTQINYVVPEGLADGLAQIRLVDDSGALIKIGLTEIRKIAPSVFTANADGQGAPAGFLTRVKPGNVHSIEPVAQFDDAQQKFIPSPIDLGPESEFIVLAVFGTGWRQFGSLSNTKVTIGGVDCPVEYVGKQPTFEGLDQINARLPRALIGKGEVDVTISFGSPYIPINPVKLKFK